MNAHNNLQGFYFWCRDHYTQVLAKYEGLDIYGEWLVPHHCIYPADKYGDFVVYDVMKDGEYWNQSLVRELAKECGFSYAPVLYDGEFKSWAHLISFVGRTEMGGEKGEGIVVKNQNTLNSKAEPFYIKIVSEEFQETAKRREIKTIDTKSVVKREREMMLSESIVTEARVRKVILKMVDNNELSPNWGSFDAVEVAKAVKSNVYRDCLKENPDIVAEIGNGFGKYCSTLVTNIVKDLQAG